MLYRKFRQYDNCHRDCCLIEETTSWRALREFKAVNLTESYILSWEIRTGSLLIDVDLALHPTHPLFEKPRPAEKACFRPAYIEFPHCVSITRGSSATGETLQNMTQQLNGGQIIDFCRSGEGQYEITGDFGRIAISSERPMVRLKDRTI